MYDRIIAQRNGSTMSPARQMKSKNTAAREPTTTRFVVELQRDFMASRIIRHALELSDSGVLGGARKVIYCRLCSISPMGARSRFQVELRNGKRSPERRFSRGQLARVTRVTGLK